MQSIYRVAQKMYTFVAHFSCQICIHFLGPLCIKCDRAKSWTTGSIPCTGKIIFSSPDLLNWSAYIRERGVLSRVINLLECDGCHYSHPSSAEVRYSGAILPKIPQMAPRRVPGRYLPPYIL